VWHLFIASAVLFVLSTLRDVARRDKERVSVSEAFQTMSPLSLVLAVVMVLAGIAATTGPGAGGV